MIYLTLDLWKQFFQNVLFSKFSSIWLIMSCWLEFNVLWHWISQGPFLYETILRTWGRGKIPNHCSLSACSQYLWMLPTTTAQLWSVTLHSEVFPFLSIVAKKCFLVLKISNQGDKISHEISEFTESPKYSAYVGCIVREYNSKWNTAKDCHTYEVAVLS